MKLRIRYENEYQTIELDTEEMDQLCVSLSLEGDDLTEEEKAEKVQEAWEEQFNRPDYNCWHYYDRHLGCSKARPGEGEDRQDRSDPLMGEVLDDRVFYRFEDARERQEEYEAVCRWVREVLSKKPDWADAFIAVKLDGEKAREYAERTGTAEYNVSKKLKKAEKKLRENFQNRQVF